MNDKTYKITDRNHISNLRHRDGYIIEGNVITMHGVVDVFRANYGTFCLSAFRVIHNGRLYERRIDEAYSAQYLVTLAKRFAGEVMGESE